MKRLRDGFLLIEILVSFLLVTTFIVICMRCSFQASAVQKQALCTIEAINQLETMLDVFNKEKRVNNISDSKFKFTYSVQPVSKPFIKGIPPFFSLKFGQRMKVITMSLHNKDTSGELQCSLPLIFKDNHGMY